MSPSGNATYHAELRVVPRWRQRTEDAGRPESGAGSAGLDSRGDREPSAAGFVGLQRMPRFGGRIGPLPGQYGCVGRELRRMPCIGRAVRGRRSACPVTVSVSCCSFAGGRGRKPPPPARGRRLPAAQAVRRLGNLPAVPRRHLQRFPKESAQVGRHSKTPRLGDQSLRVLPRSWRQTRRIGRQGGHRQPGPPRSSRGRSRLPEVPPESAHAHRPHTEQPREERSCAAPPAIPSTRNGPNGLGAPQMAAINELCASCHTAEWAEFQRPYKHRLPEGAMSCVDCHNPHGSIQRASAQSFAANEPGCFRCHGNLRGPFTFEHAPMRLEGCTACHEPHGSANPRMLIRARSPLPLPGVSREPAIRTRADEEPSRAGRRPARVSRPVQSAVPELHRMP